MADNNQVVIAGESKEQVALKLLQIVGIAEKKLYAGGNTQEGTDRKWILDTYAECLEAVSGQRDI